MSCVQDALNRTQKRRKCVSENLAPVAAPALLYLVRKSLSIQCCSVTKFVPTSGKKQ